MNHNSYYYIAELYNHIMRQIDYEGWADYIFDIYLKLDIKPGTFLEVASGNCKLSSFLNQKIGKIILTDLSELMLRNSKVRMDKVCCDMTSMPFKKKFNFIFSTFDSVNYLMNENSLLKFFKEINYLLNDNGFFTFDVSLEQNSLLYEKSLNRKGKFKDLKYKQISKYDKKNKIHKNKFIIEMGNGEITEEVHEQKIFDFFTYFRIAEKSGLTVKYCYDAFSFDDADLNSERAQFVLRKRN